MDNQARPSIAIALIAAWGVLFALAMSCGDHPKGPGCSSDKDCKNGQVCGDNKCVECNTDAQCGKGKRCSAHACTAAAECRADKDCKDGKVCEAGKCKACSTDTECGDDARCVSGACKTKTCSKDADCADDEDCVNGICHKQVSTTNPGVNCSLSTIYFAFDDSGILDSEKARLSANQDCIEKAKGKGVFLVGHTDTSGTEEYNIALSERRAQSVADYLARLGTDPARMQVVPKGETEPTGLGDDKDRRVEFQWH